MWDQLNTRSVVIFDVIKGAEFIYRYRRVSRKKKKKKAGVNENPRKEILLVQKQK